jgi:hypothetical protein
MAALLTNTQVDQRQVAIEATAISPEANANKDPFAALYGLWEGRDIDYRRLRCEAAGYVTYRDKNG